jgi:hypothetical protein
VRRVVEKIQAGFLSLTPAPIETDLFLLPAYQRPFVWLCRSRNCAFGLSPFARTPQVIEKLVSFQGHFVPQLDSSKDSQQMKAELPKSVCEKNMLLQRIAFSLPW